MQRSFLRSWSLRRTSQVFFTSYTDMNPATSEVVLLTGSSGFLGRHVLKFLAENDRVSEIRALDKVLPKGNANEDEFGYKDEKNKVRHYQCDLVDLESCREAFRGVSVVLHCAGYVNYDYPANVDKLRKNNVDATENVVKLCIEENVDRLVHCSTTEVTLQSSLTAGIFPVSIHKQESQLEIPENDGRLLFGEYAASKLRAEKIVLQYNGTTLKNGKNSLKAVALRPTLLYGEGDSHLLSNFLQLAKSRGDCLPRVCAGCKQQITYVGNAAWAFVRAMDTLRERPSAIAGLPVTVTDDTVVEDLATFCTKVTGATGRLKISSWPVPLALSYLSACLFELLSRLGVISKLKVPPRSIVAFLGSSIIYKRARASIHMNYWPKFTQDQALALSSTYYGKICSDK